MPKGGNLLYIVLLTLTLALSSASTLCENRCEKSNPHLLSLKLLWSRSPTRLVSASITFQGFIKGLITAADSRPTMGPLRNDLIRVVGKYRDCVVACEHQFSKRGGSVEYSIRQPCLYTIFLKMGTRFRPETVRELCISSDNVLSQDFQYDK